MIDDSTLNNNAAISLVKQAVGTITSDDKHREQD
jgi:hypothetical protein